MFGHSPINQIIDLLSMPLGVVVFFQWKLERFGQPAMPLACPISGIGYSLVQQSWLG
jgi:hypothetical protein